MSWMRIALTVGCGDVVDRAFPVRQLLGAGGPRRRQLPIEGGATQSAPVSLRACSAPASSRDCIAIDFIAILLRALSLCPMVRTAGVNVEGSAASIDRTRGRERGNLDQSCYESIGHASNPPTGEEQGRARSAVRTTPAWILHATAAGGGMGDHFSQVAGLQPGGAQGSAVG